MREQRLVVRVLQEILIRAGGSGLPDVLADHRSSGHAGRVGLGTAIRGDQGRGQGSAVGQPFGAADHGEVEARSHQSAGLARRDFQHPQLDASFCGVGERDVLTVRRPFHVRDPGVGRQTDHRPLRAIGEPEQGEPRVVPAPAPPVDPRGDTDARQPQLPLRQLRDGGETGQILQ